MKLFSNQEQNEKFKTKLIQYFNLKNDYEVLAILQYAVIECTGYRHDNWNEGFDVYDLDFKIPLTVYAIYENTLNDISIRLKKVCNNLMEGNDQVDVVNIILQQDSFNQFDSQDLLMTVERIKAMLISRATGQNPDENEYQNYRIKLLGIEKVKSLIPDFLIYYSTISEFWSHIQPRFPSYVLRREYITENFKPLIDFINGIKINPIHEDANNTLKKLNSNSVSLLWKKASDRLKNQDFDGAITASRTLLEDTIKTILNELNTDYSDNDDLLKIYGLVANKLKLSPSQHHEEIFKQILSGCHSVIHGLSSLRNKISDAHASGKKPAKPATRHAELAVNIAGTMATFLIATWENKSAKDVAKAP